MLLWVLLLPCALCLTLHFLTTPFTPFALSPLLDTVFRECSNPIVLSNYTSAQQVEINPDSLVFDYSYDLSVSLAANSSQTAVMWPRRFESQMDIRPGMRTYISVLTAYISSLNFTRLTIISENSQQHLLVSKAMLSAYPSVYESLITIPADADVAYTQRLVGKTIKPSGCNLFAIMTGPVSAWNLLSAFDAKKMNKVGFAYVLSDTAALFQGLQTSGRSGLLSSGVIYVATEVAGLAKSAEERELLYLLAIAKAVNAGKRSVSEVKAALEQRLVLIGMKDSVGEVKARSPEELRQRGGDLDMPGGTKVVPGRQGAVIVVSANYVFLDSDGFVFPQSLQVMRGVKVAIEEANNRTDLLPSFVVHDNSVSLSGMTFNYTFTRENVLANKASLGVLHFPPPLGTNIIQTISIFKDLNIRLPMTMSSSNTILASAKEYPYYVRTRTGHLYTAMVISRMFRFFAWTRAAVIYAKDKGDNEDLYRALMNYTKYYEINVTNSEERRGLKESITKGVTVELNDTIREIMESDVRIVLVFHYDIMIVLEAMYDLGVRSGYLICTWTSLSYTFFNGDGPRYEKRKIVGKGALQFFPRPFIGQQGAKVLQMLQAKDGDKYYPNGCHYYDCAMLYLHATDYMVRMGIDYEDPEEIMKAMRGTHFEGCTGVIAIAPGSNERMATEYSVLNVKYFEGNRSVVIEDVMYYNPFSTTLYKSLKPIMWPDNSTEVFTDSLISTFPCPFLEIESHHSVVGRSIAIAASFTVCVWTGVVVAIVWRKWWTKKYPVLVTKHEMSMDDVILMVSVPLQFFQFAAVGPEGRDLSGFISSLNASTALQLESVLTIHGTVYWLVLNSTLAGVGGYVLLCFLKLTKFERYCDCLPLWSSLMAAASMALPVVSNLLFLPIVSTLSNIFLCTKTIGETLGDNYLDKDCYTQCWTGVHWVYVAVCCCALSIYIPLGLYTKPLWQERQPVLHIRAQPVGLMVKSLMQVVLLTLDHTLKADYATVHAGLFFSILLAYVLFALYAPPYNYHR